MVDAGTRDRPVTDPGAIGARAQAMGDAATSRIVAQAGRADAPGHATAYAVAHAAATDPATHATVAHAMPHAATSHAVPHAAARPARSYGGRNRRRKCQYG